MTSAQKTAETTALLRFYRFAASALGPLLPLWVSRRARAGKEDPSRVNERYGIASLPRSEGNLVWMHGASVGESMMLLPLISKFNAARPDIHILLTSGTITAAKLMAQRLPKGAVHQFVPLDHPKYVQKFLTHWQPDLGLWTESEIWPNLITQTKASGAKLALINARMSKKSIGGWNKRARSAAALFSKFDLILAADKVTAEGLSKFSNSRVGLIGNLKDAALPLPASAQKMLPLKEAIDKRPVWCAASTHTGEDEIVLHAHLSILKDHPDALLIIAPRHPDRRDDIAESINSMGLSFSERSSEHLPGGDTQVYLFDSIGEMGIAYRLAPVTLMCGSLLPGLSGHNPLEPARLGSAILTGPHISSFADVYADIGHLKTVSSSKDISDYISNLFSNTAALERAQKNSRLFCDSRADILPRLWDELLPLLPAKALL